MPENENRGWGSRPVVAVVVVLLLAFAVGSYIQLAILERLKLVVLSSMENVSSRALGSSTLMRTAVKALSPGDWLVISFSVFLLAVFVFVQVKLRMVSEFLKFVLADERRTLGFLLFLSVLTLKPILAPGAPYFLDAPAHVSRAWFTYVNLAQGYPFPSFTNYYHNGFALFSHYGWLPSYLIALANFIFHNINASSKIVVFLFSVGDTFLFYALGRKIFGGRSTGLLLALIFCSSNLFLYDVLWSGTAFYPWVFLGMGVMLLSYESWFSGSVPIYTSALLTALGSAILINAHLGYASQALLFFAVYSVGRTLVFAPGRFASFAGYGAAAAGIGAVLGAFVFLPTLLDIKDVNFFKAFPFFDLSTYKFWRAPLWQFLVPRPFYTNLSLNYLGLGLAAAGVVFAVRFLRERNRWFTFCMILLAFSLAVIGYDRNAFLVMLSVAFLVVGGYAALAEKRDAKLGVFAALLMALLCDALLFNNFNTGDTRGGFENAVYNRLEKDLDGTRYGVVMANTLHTGNDTGNDVFVSPWLKLVGHVVMQPNAIMLEANKQAIYQYGFTSDLLVPDIRNGRLTAETLAGLDLIGVKYITFHDAFQYFVPVMQQGDGLHSRADGPWLELPLTSPILYAPSTVNVNDLENDIPDLKQRAAFESDNLSHARAPFTTRPIADSYLRAVIAATALDPKTANAKRFLLRAGTGEDLGGGAGAAAPAKVTVSRYTVDSQKVVLDFDLDRRGFVAVPFGYFWYHRVLVDGSPATFLPTVENTICVRIATPGRHTLTIGPSVSPARRAGALISASGLVLFLALLLVLRVLRRRKPGPASTLPAPPD